MPYGDRYRFINIALIAASAGFGIWLVSIWTSPWALPSSKEKRAVRASTDAYAKPFAASASYNVIVDKDLFRPARQRYIAPKPKPVVPPPPPPPPPRKPPPRLTLIGTVLLDDGEAAVIDFAGGQKAAFYRLGDDIEGYVIKEIHKDRVVLEKEGEVIKALMSQSSSPQAPFPTPIPIEVPQAPPMGAAPNILGNGVQPGQQGGVPGPYPQVPVR